MDHFTSRSWYYVLCVYQSFLFCDLAMKITIQKEIVQAPVRTLSSNWTFEKPQETKHSIGYGVEETLTIELLSEALPEYSKVNIHDFKDISLSYKDNRKIKSWIKKNAKGLFYYAHGLALFEKQEDAVLFKMFWC